MAREVIKKNAGGFAGANILKLREGAVAAGWGDCRLSPKLH
ncbi:MAG: hypothetical protein RMM53_11555 [Bacteroidia bacterium]|nr:hypothetical protein [Bacteroidia bacterium]MDW8334843.1 hypothetical protein [Bacteroidia bacterium]